MPIDPNTTSLAASIALQDLQRELNVLQIEQAYILEQLRIKQDQLTAKLDEIDEMQRFRDDRLAQEAQAFADAGIPLAAANATTGFVPVPSQAPAQGGGQARVVHGLPGQFPPLPAVGGNAAINGNYINGGPAQPPIPVVGDNVPAGGPVGGGAGGAGAGDEGEEDEGEDGQ